MASIRDVAKLAGVSVSTVSNVQNGTKYVSPELTRKVQRAIQQLDYRADPIARNMKGMSSRTIGVIAADICGVFYPYVLKGIYEVAAKEGYSVVIFDAHTAVDGLTPFEQEKKYIQDLLAQRVDGILFFSNVPEKEEGSYALWLQELAAQSPRPIAFVSLERDFSAYGIDSVYTDSFYGAWLAVSHLFEVGCRHIGHIAGPLHSAVAVERFRGYKDALKKHGLAFRTSRVAEGDYTHQSGYATMQKLLASPIPLDGVYIANDQMAIGAYKAISEQGLRIPEDIKIVGNDNVFLSSIVTPELSTIHIRKRHMGINAVKLLLERVEGNRTQVARIQLETFLVKRQSTGFEAKAAWFSADW